MPRSLKAGPTQGCHQQITDRRRQAHAQNDGGNHEEDEGEEDVVLRQGQQGARQFRADARERDNADDDAHAGRRCNE